MVAFLTQEEIPEEGDNKKQNTKTLILLLFDG